MSYVFRQEEPVAAGVRRIAREQIDAAVAELNDPALDRHEAVHQVRKRCKKLRALLRLVRPVLGDVYHAENARFRDAARTLSAVRDATALLEAYDALTTHYGATLDRRAAAPIRRALTLRRRHVAETFDLDGRIDAFLTEMEAARRAVDGWPLDADEFDALDGGLRKTYGRARRAMDHAYAEPSDEAFHEWRKRVKYHWYHSRLLTAVWPAVMTPRTDALDALAGLLGDEHDLAVFRQVLTGEPDRFAGVQALPAFLGLLDRRRAELQAEVRPLGRRLLAEPPRALAHRLGTYWAVWREDPARPPALAAPA